MKIIAVSGCFLYNCRFDKVEKETDDMTQFLNKLKQSGYAIIPVCPEQMGGLPTPRVRSEKKGDRVFNFAGVDVTENFINGSNAVLKVLQFQNINKAILKQKSPSCGKDKIYDGTFQGNLIQGNGITTQLLLDNGISVYTEDDIEELENILLK